MQVKIAIAGGTGLIGSKLTDYFVSQGHTIYILTRNPSNKPEKEHVHYVEWLTENSQPENELNGISAIINLAGKSIAEGRWTDQQKEAIIQSRLQSTRSMFELISNLKEKPLVLINASAIGYYGNSLTEVFTEESEPISPNFLTQVVRLWEHEAKACEGLGLRVVTARLGIVLDSDEGALQPIVLPYKLFAGGTVGSGKQWLSWVHIDDVVGLFSFALTHSELSGPLNVTAPEPVRMKQFGQTVSKVLKRPHWLPVPSLPLRMLLGEKSTLVLDGQKVLPEKAMEYQYTFKFPSLYQALTDLYDANKQ